MEEITENYLSKHSYNPNIYRINDYMYDLIRNTKPAYSILQWKIIAGNVGNSYLNYIKNNHINLYNFFKDLKLIDNSGNVIDFVHEIATKINNLANIINDLKEHIINYTV